MAGQVHAFERPERFVAGTVGEPGDRTFYLQATDQSRIVSVVLEKTQVALLAERLVELLDEAQRRLGADTGDEPDDVDTDPLAAPVEEEFRVGTLSLAWDAESSTVIVEATAQSEDEEAPEDELDSLRVRLTATETRAFVARAIKVVAAGRPPCPLCGLPLEAGGHVCPRSNGYRR
ncbi:DUF3090 family protein [Cryptosporangium phraense]|uniref:DUF3090 family protein n=1 Tax=Cryptosporangium phraense TaxID=2593070 RepID=A0A545AGL7_9ACTN|nr:DUF3090 family protein [Cryptosporangium phraense]TQS40476.1 DUF3090 family protein [Cryptosporangium phraense]